MCRTGIRSQVPLDAAGLTGSSGRRADGRCRGGLRPPPQAGHRGRAGGRTAQRSEGFGVAQGRAASTRSSASASRPGPRPSATTASAMAVERGGRTRDAKMAVDQEPATVLTSEAQRGLDVVLTECAGMTDRCSRPRWQRSPPHTVDSHCPRTQAPRASPRRRRRPASRP